MKKIALYAFVAVAVGTGLQSCKKNQPSYKIEGNYTGHFQGNYQGNDTIVNTGFAVKIEAQDKNTAHVIGNLFKTFEVLVTPNGLNIELVSPTDGLNQFLYEGETGRLTFNYEEGGNTAVYDGYKK